MSTALLVVDMLNRYEHEDAEPLMRSARDAVPHVARLVEVARAHEIPVVFVNDNHDDWAAGRAELTDSAMAGAAPDLIEPLAPADDVPLLVKARHSAFYLTQLEYLLREREASRVILTGQVTEQCILYTALDAYVRHFDVIVPSDAVAHIHPDLGDAALRMMERNMGARVLRTDDLVTDLGG